MRNHEILERHEKEERCGQSLSIHRASSHRVHMGSELSSRLYVRVFRVFRGESSGLNDGLRRECDSDAMASVSA